MKSTKKSIANWRNVSASTNRKYCLPCGNSTSSFYQSRNVEPFHKEFLRSFFREEIFPYLSPVPVSKDKVISFLRDNRLYLAIRLYPKGDKAQRDKQTKEELPNTS